MGDDRYRTISRFYDAVVEPTTAPLRRIGLSLHRPRSGMTVLDVGCGTGTHLGMYAAEGCAVSGIDLSPSMLDRARRRLGLEADLRLADATAMPFASDTFDLVLASMIVHELDPTIRSAAVAEMARVLKDSGRALVIDYAVGDRNLKGKVARSVSTIVERTAGKDHFRNFRQFSKTTGIPAQFAAHNFVLDSQRIVSGGNIGVFFLKPDGL